MFTFPFSSISNSDLRNLYNESCISLTELNNMCFSYDSFRDVNVDDVGANIINSTGKENYECLYVDPTDIYRDYPDQISLMCFNIRSCNRNFLNFGSELQII